MRILIAYATRAGSTRGIAEEIAATLRDRGVEADVSDAHDALSLDGYDAVILGSAIRTRRWLKEAMGFLNRHREQLMSMPIAYFTVSLTGLHDSPRAREEAARYCEYAEEKLPEIAPVARGCFNGALDLSQLSSAERVFVRAFGVAEGDYRDWDAIRAWSLEAAEALGVLQPTHA